MDLKPRVDVNFARVDINHCDLFPLQIFFILISMCIKVPLILHIKFQQNIPSHSGGKVGFHGFAIFSISGHLGFSTRLTSTGLKPCSLIMLHVKFEIHRCSAFREKSFKWTYSQGQRKL